MCSKGNDNICLQLEIFRLPGLHRRKATSWLVDRIWWDYYMVWLFLMTGMIEIFTISFFFHTFLVLANIPCTCILRGVTVLIYTEIYFKYLVPPIYLLDMNFIWHMLILPEYLSSSFFVLFFHVISSSQFLHVSFFFGKWYQPL